MRWERNEREPFVSMYREIIKFLGREPWPEPQSRPEALLAVRRQRGLRIPYAAASIGVNESTWCHWERDGGRVSKGKLTALSTFTGRDVRARFPGSVR